MKITPLDKWIKKKIGYKGCDDFRKELDNYVLDKLQKNIEYVKANSVFYKNHLKDIKQISSFEDFQRIPFTDDLDIMRNPNNFVCVSQNYINRIVTLTTSGTTGESKRIFFTKEDQELTTDFFEIGMSTLVEKGDRVLILLPGERAGSVGDLLQRALERLGVKAYIHGPVYNGEKVLQIIRDWSINSLVGIPVQVLLLARLEKNERDIKLKSVLLSTDYAPNTVIREIERIFKCKVFDHYGMTEMGLGGGVQCQALNGYHLREADLYFEIINPVTKEVLPNGEYGEVVFTTLTRNGMPLIRYRTGDVSRIIDEPCSCGTTLRSLDKIVYRIEGSISLGDKEILTIGELDEILFSIEGLTDFNATVAKKGKKDCLTIYVNMKQRMQEDVLVYIYDFLQASSAIQTLIRKDRLILNIEKKKENWNYSNGTQKRKIIDMRNER